MVDNNNTNTVIYTIDEQTLSKFLKKKTKKPAIVTVTYQSFQKFVNVIINENIQINRLIYDEARHAVGENIQSIVFHSRLFNRRVKCTEFWTATPVNRNGIIMDPMMEEFIPIDDDENSFTHHVSSTDDSYDSDSSSQYDSDSKFCVYC